MKKNFLGSLVLLILLLGASSAQASQNYGRYLCMDCDIEMNSTMTSFVDIIGFIKATHITTQYVPGDIVTVCNGSVCQSVSYTGSGNFAPFGPPITDPRKSYKNGISATPSGNGPYTYQATVIGFSPSDSEYIHYKVIIGDPVPVGAGSGGGGGAWGNSTVISWGGTDDFGNREYHNEY